MIRLTINAVLVIASFSFIFWNSIQSYFIYMLRIINYMINKKAQTVQGYLTPTKLLTSILKQNKDKSLSKINRSTYSASRNAGQQEDSTFIIDTSNSARDYQKNSFVTESNLIKPYAQNTLKKKELKPKQQKYILPKQLKQVQNQRLRQSQQSHQSKKRQNVSHFNFNAEPERSNHLNSIINDNKYFNLNRNDTPNSYVRQSNDSRIINKNPQIMTLQCYDLIRKLTKVKEGLQLQISELQRLLDNTSKYLQNIDGQYQKIKQNILSYTSLCLDNAFKQYKTNMVQWGKYQDYERKGLQMLKQISQYIQSQQQSLNQKMNYKEITAHSIDLSKRIQFYGQVSQQIRNAREKCIGMRPTISQQKIRAFERGVTILCDF